MFALNIEKRTLSNKYYRKIIYTDKFQQLVLMCLEPGEDIPEEKHDGTQFFRIESGNGFVRIGRQQKILRDGVAFIIPSNKKHYVKNTSKNKPLKLYTIYSPPQHVDLSYTKRQKNI